MAGHCQPMPLPEIPGHSQESLAQSLVGSLFLSPPSWGAQGFVCALQESVSQLLWKFCHPMEGLQSNPSGLQSQIPWGFSVPLLDYQVRKSVVGPRIFVTELELLWLIVLQFVGCMLSSSKVGLMATSSQRAYIKHHASQVCCSKSPVPTVGHCWPVPSQETLKHSKRFLE